MTGVPCIAGLEADGQSLEIGLRGRLEVRLPESQVSGYLWDCRYRCPCLQLDDSEYVEQGQARFTGLGERRWYFRAVATGECLLEFFLVRPWSGPSPEYRLTVRVR